MKGRPCRFRAGDAKRDRRAGIQRRVPIDEAAEWLEADGLGGYASGTVGTLRSRRYHGVRVTATTPPTGRMVLVAGLDVAVESGGPAEALTAQRYEPGVTHPARAAIESFACDPWPTWVYRLADDTRLRAELFCISGRAATMLRWTRLDGAGAVRLRVRPLISARDYHTLQHENGSVNTKVIESGARVFWRLYEDVPGVVCVSNGTWTSEVAWYRQFLYEEERCRGLDAVEDLIALGALEFDLDRGPAVLAVTAAAAGDDLDASNLACSIARAADAERARRVSLGGPLERAADQYLVRRGIGRTLVAGYPWFTDWGRDTFIAMRGLCVATGRLDVARDILLEWATAGSRGMLPNRFADAGEAPEYNSVDASLWYCVVVGELLAHPGASAVLSAHDRSELEAAVTEILRGYARGTRYGIRCDDDGLLAAGEPGVQLTWMDARVGERVITPRIGKPVEIQALWINALDAGSRVSRRWLPIRDAARQSFAERFWNDARGCLFDVVDVDHVRGRADESVRPNQVLALGGLPLSLVCADRARQALDLVERLLWTPMGLRSLSPDTPDYAPRYTGGPAERDAVYHQGTVWPWLIGPFVEAWWRLHGATTAAAAEAEARFLAPLDEHLRSAGLGHVSEVADGDAPHHPGGCPFQAWSLGELIRIRRLLGRT